MLLHPYLEPLSYITYLNLQPESLQKPLFLLPYLEPLSYIAYPNLEPESQSESPPPPSLSFPDSTKRTNKRRNRYYTVFSPLASSPPPFLFSSLVLEAQTHVQALFSSHFLFSPTLYYPLYLSFMSSSKPSPDASLSISTTPFFFPVTFLSTQDM